MDSLRGGVDPSRVVEAYKIKWNVLAGLGLAGFPNGIPDDDDDIPDDDDVPHIFSNPQLADQTLIRSGILKCKSVSGSGSKSSPRVERDFEFFVQGSAGAQVDIFAKVSAGEPSEISVAEVIHQNWGYHGSVLRNIFRNKLVNIPRGDRPKTPASSLADTIVSQTERWVKTTLTPQCSKFFLLKFEFVLERKADAQTAINSVDHGGFMKSISDYLFSQKHSDVIISCGQSEFPAHKVIICAKSPVLDSMFSHPLTESETGKLEIKDAEPEIVEEFLRFLYTGAVTDLAKNASELFVLADKYDVQGLKIMSEQSILGTITEQNVLELYGLGKLLRSDAIVRRCVEKIKPDPGFTKEELGRLAQQFPDVLFDILYLK